MATALTSTSNNRPSPPPDFSAPAPILGCSKPPWLFLGSVLAVVGVGLLLWAGMMFKGGGSARMEVVDIHLRRLVTLEEAVLGAVRKISDGSLGPSSLASIDQRLQRLEQQQQQRASCGGCSVIRWDDACFLTQMANETKRNHESRLRSVDPTWTTPTVICILSRMPDAFFEPPTEDIVANETLHRQFIFSKHMAMLRLAQPYCELPVITFRVDMVTALAGGTGDRCKGLVTGVMLALLSNSQFAPYWYNPNNVEEYFHFPRMDVSAPEPQLDVPYVSDAERLYKQLLVQYNDSTGRLLKVMMDNPSLASPTIDWNSALLGEGIRHLILHYNFPTWHNLTENTFYRPIARLYGLDNMSWIKQFRLIQHHFFDNPRAELASALDDALARFPPRMRVRIGLQLRTGRSEWGEGKVHGDDPLCFAREALKFCTLQLQARGLPPLTPCGFYLTSDSIKAREAVGVAIKAAQPESFVLQLEQGHIYHVDRDHGGPLKGDLIAIRKQFVNHWLEWRLLFKMDALVISRSGFAETAAWGINVPTRYAVRPRSPSDVPCRFVDLTRDSAPLSQAIQ